MSYHYCEGYIAKKWWTITLRCWVAFIALTNFGAALRCFTENDFLQSKFLGNSNEGSVSERVYGCWSIINGIILLTCFCRIEDKILTGLSACVISVYLSFFGLEAYFYKTLVLHGPTIYPCALSGLTLLWLLMDILWPAGTSKPEMDENELLRKQFHFKSLNKKFK